MTVHRSFPKTSGFHLGIYVFKDAEIVDFAGPKEPAEQDGGDNPTQELRHKEGWHVVRRDAYIGIAERPRDGDRWIGKKRSRS